MKKLSTEQFIEKAKLVHGDKYDYSKVNYINNTSNIIITCKIHGDFYQTPNSHISQKSGCCKCKFEKISMLKTLNTEQFIEKAKLVHDDKYDYSKVNYINSKKNILIACKIHGDFYQTPNSHISQKSGCCKCKFEKISMLKTLNTEQFIEKAKLVHGDKYDYSKVNYKRSSTKINIICKIHGDFYQTPKDHLRNHGCTICGYGSAGEEKINNLLKINKTCFKKQISFKELGQKRFDFGIYNNNDLLCLIEYDGIQHFEPIDFFGGDMALKESKIRDKQKEEFCKIQNIPLLRIKYNDNIEIKLINFLKELKCSV